MQDKSMSTKSLTAQLEELRAEHDKSMATFQKEFEEKANTLESAIKDASKSLIQQVNELCGTDNSNADTSKPESGAIQIAMKVES